jgi:Zn-dependent metalloprotease
MKHPFKVILIAFLSLCTMTVQAQFKKVTFDPTVKIKKENILLNDVKRSIQETSNNKHDISLEFRPMNGGNLAAIKTGLKPGILNDRNVPAYIEGALKNVGSRGMTTEALALEYLHNAAPIMKINDPTNEFNVLSTHNDELGMTHVKLQQKIKNVAVYGAQIIIHGTYQTFDFLNGSYYPTIEMSTVTPSFSEDVALQHCMSDLGEIKKYDYEKDPVFKDLKTTNELVIYPHEGSFYLAYHISTYKNLVERWEYFIDAHSGQVINKFQSICKFHNHKHGAGESCSHAETLLLDGKATATALDLFNVNRQINTYQVGNKYYLIDGSRDIFSSSAAQLPNDPEGVIWTIDAFNTSPQNDNFSYDHVTSSNNTWNNKAGVSAHYNGGKAFEYFRNIHNRQSINGSGGNIVSLINVADEDGNSMGNAFWNGAAMFYGNGDVAFQPLARGLDVAGHEMTHGVIQSTANLEYEGESGALNESFADVFGAMIDRDDWKIGEDVVKTSFFPSGALRDLENPHNGASTNNFDKGWQPRHYNERYQGTEDNGGVHINSGIPNFAFFKFATAVGKDKAEKVFYRALSTYLTKSSKFVDCRVAVIKATTDLYGTTEINAAKKAFDEVGILGTDGGDYEVDNQTNPGQEFVLTTGGNNDGLFIYNTSGQSLGQISTNTVLSKPSISDNGSEIVFVGDDNKLYYIYIDWSKNPATFEESAIGSDPIWRNTIISKDGSKIAALTTEENNEIIVFHFGASTTRNDFELYNPTYTQGVSTGDVNYADAMEFDITGEYIMYDAENELKSNTSGSITYWDISFIKVWNNASNSFSLGTVEKLYASLPNEVSIGNPTFSKNSPYIIAFDYIDENGDVSVLGGNIETGDVGLIFENNALGYPNFSSKDDRIVFDNEGSTSFNLGIVNLQANKIEPTTAPATIFTTNKRWAVWFSNGQRSLSSSEDIINPASQNLSLLSNPVSNLLQVQIKNLDNTKVDFQIIDISGKVYLNENHQIIGPNDIIDISVASLPSGTYFLKADNKREIQTLKFTKF